MKQVCIAICVLILTSTGAWAADSGKAVPQPMPMPPVLRPMPPSVHDGKLPDVASAICDIDEDAWERGQISIYIKVRDISNAVSGVDINCTVDRPDEADEEGEEPL